MTWLKEIQGEAAQFRDLDEQNASEEGEYAGSKELCSEVEKRMGRATPSRPDGFSPRDYPSRPAVNNPRGARSRFVKRPAATHVTDDGGDAEEMEDAMGAAEEDLEFADGRVRVKGIPDISLGLGEIARAVAGIPGLGMPGGTTPGLEASSHFQPETLTYANGSHMAEVEVDAETGELVWRARGQGEGTLIMADGKLIILTTDGELVVAEASPKAYKEIAAAQILEGSCLTAPTLAGGRLYLRNLSEIICLDLARKKGI